MLAKKDFEWKCYPQAESFLLQWVQTACQNNPAIFNLEKELQEATSTRLFDWVDHFIVPFSDKVQNQLQELGFTQEKGNDAGLVYYHSGALFPRVLMTNNELTSYLGITIKVDRIADFLMMHNLSSPIEGTVFSGYRRCHVNIENNTELIVIERRGTQTIEPTFVSTDQTDSYLRAKELWQTRPRDLASDDEAMNQTLTVAKEMVNLLGKDMAASVVLECEREYWQARNVAGLIQKGRQDRVGMGWANHDHHTFRSSRFLFPRLVQLFEIFGFYCREKFYAGEQAGWGAQVMENNQSGHVLFLDLDLTSAELEIDFAHQSLQSLNKVGTVGLWCALHGDSILQAGMHHLEAQFEFDNLVKSLKRYGVETMEPFSQFPYLKQAFTKGELWHVPVNRIDSLLRKGIITKKEADIFKSHGAIGSHMENLQRREGFKGFNQLNVSKIIKETDPRKAILT